MCVCTLLSVNICVMLRSRGGIKVLTVQCVGGEGVQRNRLEGKKSKSGSLIKLFSANLQKSSWRLNVMELQSVFFLKQKGE